MPTKKTSLNEEEIINLLNDVLPEVTQDPAVSGKIMNAVQKKLRHKSQVAAFHEYCQKCPLPDLTDDTIKELTARFEHEFGKQGLQLDADNSEDKLFVEVQLNDAVLTSEIPVNNRSLDEDEEPEVKLKFIPFPVALDGDPELVWMMAKKENLSPDEAGMALANAQAEYWETKGGQNALRKGAQRNFPDFVSRVPAKLLGEVGLKRHYKDPETVKVIRQLKPGKKSPSD